MEARRKNSHRMIAVLAIVVLIAGYSITGCSTSAPQTTTASTNAQAQSTATPQVTEPANPFADPLEISIGIWSINADNSNPDKDALVAQVTKKFNITFKPVTTTWDDYQQKIQMWAAAGSLPDIVAIDMVGNQLVRNAWINQGVVKALPDDLSKYPNVNQLMQLPDIAGLKGADGKQYCIPRSGLTKQEYSAANDVIYYRWDWAQKLNITKEPETLDELTAMLKAFVDKDPEGKKTAGLTIHAQTYLNMLFLPYNPSILNWTGTPYSWVKEDGQFIPAFMSKKTLDGLTVLRNLYDQGLIDKDFPLLKASEGDAKFDSGRAGAVITNDPNWANFNTTYPDKVATDCLKIFKIWPAADGNRYQSLGNTYWSETYFNSGIDDKKMSRILTLYDYLLSPEGRDLFRWGIEGVDYTKVGDKYFVADSNVDLGKKYQSKTWLGVLATWDSDFQFDPSSPAAQKHPDQFKFSIDFANWAKDNLKVGENVLQISMMSTPLKDKFAYTFSDDVVNVILSKEPVDQAWAAIVQGYKDKGIDQMITEVNAKAAELGIK